MKAHLLLADDGPPVLEQEKIFLEKEDDRLEVETAVSMDEALEPLDEEDYDAIVSDPPKPVSEPLLVPLYQRPTRGCAPAPLNLFPSFSRGGRICTLGL
ncbi:hypothetical protein AKJ57_06245 [candidate division MSBL1 archaeon SCGC-AAA259A05]|uniref:Response regulatory domain-containing protein n=1 Tax=candidate division MSBL1 archaeon SCGC-AAA259A05 TaxID=1698259 RepID=A0A133U3T0_9EURY|nr:hypothetical protein AKJ57_06245 [candidate division MSBL1 archaeon SCGC-AAA259A05]